MALEVKFQSDAEEFGDKTDSVAVSMCYFSVVSNDNEKFKFLKSTGFGSCVGLVLRSEATTLLAHFQSANWAKTGIELTIQAFGKQGVLDFQQFEGFLFFGSNKDDGEKVKQKRSSGDFSSKRFDTKAFVDKSVVKSNESSKKGLEDIHQAFLKLGAKFPTQAPTAGYYSVAVNPATGEVRLFNETPKSPIVRNFLFVKDGDALIFYEPK